jgi:hypothetical protein
MHTDERDREREPEDEVDELAAHSQELGDDIQEARQDLQRKREDAGVPGIPPEAEKSD